MRNVAGYRVLWSKAEDVVRVLECLKQIRHVRVGVELVPPGEKPTQDECERLRVYRAEQDLSGVVEADGPLGPTGIETAGRKRRNRR